MPVVYTGFVTRSAPEHARSRMRRKLGLKKSDILVVASAGGGKVGFDLLRSVLRASTLSGNRPATASSCVYRPLHEYAGIPPPGTPERRDREGEPFYI